MSAKPNKVGVAVVQAAFGDCVQDNVAKVEALLTDAAAQGARIVVVPELFEGPYFPKIQHERFFQWAQPADGHPTVERLAELAARLDLLVPVSFFERDGSRYYNSVAIVDGERGVLGVYRKSHIPDGPGYEEKFYFRASDDGFRTWSTAVGDVGVGICWDQWFPECARVLALEGAQLLLYPTAIGSEPQDPTLDTRLPWRRVMIGHAVANCTPVAAANRVGTEDGQTFYGGSFIADHRGEVLAELDAEQEGVAVAYLDLEEIGRYRSSFGLFGDRRPELYTRLTKP